MNHFVEWDSIEVRVNGAKIEAMAQSIVAAVPEIGSLRLRFANGLLRVEGSIRKFVSVPFTVDITESRAAGTTSRGPLAAISTFAGIPVPRFLVGVLRDKLPRDVVRFEEPATLVLSLDRFLPTFVSVDLQRIWIIDGGLSLILGRGGADLPAGESHGATERRTRVE